MMKKLMICLLCFGVFLNFQSCEKELFDDDQIFGSQSEVESHNRLDRVCNMSTHMNKLLSDPIYKERHQQKFLRLDREEGKVKNRIGCDTPPLIPVAVHFQGASGADLQCLTELAELQIQILNDDFQGTNTDINKWNTSAANSFPGVDNSESCIQFAIANQNHPSGFGLANGDAAVTMNKTTGDFNQAWSGYLNIYVQFDTGVLGYAPLGGEGNGDGVVIEAMAFAKGAGCGNIKVEEPFDLGRTTTHEVGHYLLLDHIWGDGCGTDDEVADTPESDEPYYECPGANESSCGTTDMHMNYMDYTNDACMYMFTSGQASRSENYISSSLSNLLNNATNVISGAPDNGGGEDNGDDSGDDGDSDGDSGDDNGDNDDGNDDSGNGDSDCLAEATDYYTGTPLTEMDCYEEVIASDEYCCGVEFDYLCQEAYDECVGFVDNGDGCNIVAVDWYSGDALKDSECVAYVQEYDVYCCETEWDGLCQYFYDECSVDASNFSEFKSDDVMVLVSQDKNTGNTKISYSLRNWNPNTNIEITASGKKLFQGKVTNRRGTIEKNLVQYRSASDIKVQLVQGNKVVADASLRN